MNASTGKTAIVTGASTGIGYSCAEALARDGFTVFGTSRRPSNNGPKNVTMLACDVTDRASVDALVATVLERTGRIDVLVNNAGIGLIGGAEESSDDQVKSLFDVNVFGLMRVTNAVLPAMRRQHEGRIINVSSVLGLIPAPYSAHYSATKHAVEGYSESLDHEVRAFNIRVALVQPAVTRTVFEQNTLEPDATLPDYDNARTMARANLQDAMTKGEPAEVVADAVIAAATAKHMRRRYPAGKVAPMIAILRRFMPANMFDKTLRKQMHLPV
ncbi:MAG TPA: oxidoreductase [Parvibaculum sp.]